MKLSIKNLKQVIYPLEVESDQIEISELKKEIEKAYKFDHETLNLVFNGIRLIDSKKLCEYYIKEDSVIIMMNSKAKPAKVSILPQEEAKKEDKVIHSQENIIQQQLSQAQIQVQEQIKPKKDYSNQLKKLIDMGFPTCESESAVIAGKGNIALAIDYLSNGIPLTLPMYEGMEGDLPQSSALKNIASLVKILCQNDPSRFHNILMSLQHTSPEIVEFVQENEAEFRELIQSPITQEDLKNFQAFNQNTRIERLGFRGSSGAKGNEGHKGHRSQNALTNFLMNNRTIEQEKQLNIDCKLILNIFVKTFFFYL